MQPMTRFNTTSPRQQLWLAFIVLAALAASYVFACATPFAALATAAALTLNRNNGIVFILAAWLGNQVIGYAVLDYPQDTYSFYWGAIIGGAALVALAAARATAARVSVKSESVRIAVCFAAALISNQLFMFAAAFTPLGGLSGFTNDIIQQVAIINAAAMVVIYGLKVLAVTVGFLPAASAKAA